MKQNEKNDLEVKHVETRFPKLIHHEMIPGIGWVPPGHPLHPDTQEIKLFGKGEK